VFGRKLREALAVIDSYRSLADKLEADKDLLNALLEKTRQERDEWRLKRTLELSRAESAEKLAAQYAQLMDSAMERLLRAPEPVPVTVHHDETEGKAAMARLHAQLEAEEELAAESKVPLGEAAGVNERIHAIYGDDPKPPPKTVWGRDLLKEIEEPESGNDD
jgi:hypothetical protein